MCSVSVLNVARLPSFKTCLIVTCHSDNAVHNGESRKEAMVHEIFTISPCLSDSHGWVLVSV